MKFLLFFLGWFTFTSAFCIPSPGLGFQFGQSISTNGNILVVGAPYGSGTSSKGPGTVSIYTFNQTHWTPTQTLIGPGSSGTQFGYSVALDTLGDTLIVGIPGLLTSGIAYGGFSVYKNEGGTFTLQSTNVFEGSTNSLQGFSVAVSTFGNLAVVGSPQQKDSSGNSIGRTEVDQFNGLYWAPIDQFQFSGSAVEQGYSVAINGNGTLVVTGAPRYSINYPIGAAYVYSIPSGNLTILKDSSLEPTANFGSSVSVSQDGTLLAVGVPGPQKVYIYQQVSLVWTLTQKISLSGYNYPNTLSLGTTVSLSADGSLLTVSGTDNVYGTSGTAGYTLLFTYSGGMFVYNQTLLISSVPQTGSVLPISNVVLTNYVVIGDPNIRANGSTTMDGQVCVYSL